MRSAYDESCTMNHTTIVTAKLTMDLTDDPLNVRRRLAHLDSVPAGARVQINIGETHPGYDAVHLLRRHRSRLHVHINGVNRADRVSAWFQALTDADWAV